MQQDLWLKAKARVLASLKPVWAMKATSNNNEAGQIELKKDNVNDDTIVSVTHKVSVFPTKTSNPAKSTRTHQELHKELLLVHKRGLVVKSKPELQQVLEKRRLDRTKKEECERDRTPLEEELMRRVQKHEEKERMEAKAEKENNQEFLMVKANLRKTAHIRQGNSSSTAQS
ncbi:protein FAM107B [Erpetoichthys calabaricus]|uniref:protein FAM107B n=1 Tax=Erpetoichthys calabaricus TaxID=27687 RepID=UPI002233E47F|nr:protein FAM107B [Erpetoichthys calabaricus]